MDNEELIQQILNEFNNLKKLDYSLSQNEIAKNKDEILQKTDNLLSQIQNMKSEDEKEITTAINNIKLSNSVDDIDESINSINIVLNKYIEKTKEQQVKINEEKQEEEELQHLKEKETIDALSGELESYQKADYVKKITAKRGRLIRKIQSEISKIKKSGKTDEKTLEILEQLETRLSSEISNHKNQLDDRYKKEFYEKEATVPAIFTALPKGVALQVRKVETCIREMRAAKTNKQRIFAAVNVAKALGMTLATPVIFTVKFIIKHWYLVLLLLSLIKFRKPDTNTNNKPKAEPETELAYEPSLEMENELATESSLESETELVNESSLESETGLVNESSLESETGLVNVSNIESEVGLADSTTVETSLINETNVETTAEMTTAFVNGLEKNYNFLVGELHEDIEIVHSAQEFADATGVSVDKAESVYLQTVGGTIRPYERTIVWPEKHEDWDLRYFGTVSELMKYVVSGADPELSDYYTKFGENYGKSFFDNFNIASIVDSAKALGEQLGIATDVAVVLFIIYEGAQYGLAPLTGGTSLLFPG